VLSLADPLPSAPVEGGRLTEQKFHPPAAAMKQSLIHHATAAAGRVQRAVRRVFAAHTAWTVNGLTLPLGGGFVTTLRRALQLAQWRHE